MSTTYHKIQSPWKRDRKTGAFLPEFTSRELEYLAPAEWEWTEKIDGTNIRVEFDPIFDEVDIRGRTDKAELLPALRDKLTELFDPFKLSPVFDDLVTLYGEGIGPKIQGGGRLRDGRYDFVLFDVKVGERWLKQEAVEQIAVRLGLVHAPVLGGGTLWEAAEMVRDGFDSTIADLPVQAEGLVLRPPVRLRTEQGHRIITKLKTRDNFEAVL